MVILFLQRSVDVKRTRGAHGVTISPISGLMPTTTGGTSAKGDKFPIGEIRPVYIGNCPLKAL